MVVFASPRESECIQRFVKITIVVRARVCTEFTMRAFADWTISGVRPHHEDLFQIVTNVDHQDRVTASDNTISTCHRDTVNADDTERLSRHRHAGMEEVRECPVASGFILDVLEPASWEVCEENLPSV